MTKPARFLVVFGPRAQCVEQAQSSQHTRPEGFLLRRDIPNLRLDRDPMA